MPPLRRAAAHKFGRNGYAGAAAIASLRTMWGRKPVKIEGDGGGTPSQGAPRRLRDAVREARIEAADRTGVVVDLHDAEVVRLELLNDALNPVFEEIEEGVDLFDRGISRGDTPRLWLDSVAHVLMGRDKRQYRFVQDTRYGRKVLAESYEIADIADAMTKYVARRLVERDRSLADDATGVLQDLRREAQFERRRRRWRAFRAFAFGIAVGLAGLFLAAWLIAFQQS